jgi:hypothetical protein
MSIKQPKSIPPVFSALLFFAFMNQASAADYSFNGVWIYEQTCGAQQVASVRLTQKGSEVAGEWSDGSTRGAGVYGQLKGELKNNKLFVRYCGGEESAGYAVCPKYEAEFSDYFVHQGKDLVWYKMAHSNGKIDYRKYLVLPSTVNGKATILDSHCANE